jgi:hypothetical protein
MFILNPYDRYFSKSTNANKAPQPLNVTTNSSPGPARRFMDSITRSRKASPVLSVATASAPVVAAAVATQTHTNYIPFPSSAPITCPSQTDRLELEFDSDSVICIDGPSSLTFSWQISVQPASCSAIEEHFQALPAENAKPRLPIGRAISSAGEGGRHGRRVRVLSGGHGVFNTEHASPSLKHGRREKSVERKLCHGSLKKTGQKSISDVKFLIALHQSICWHLKSSNISGPGQSPPFRTLCT